MINPFHEVNWRPDLAERRKFAKSLVIGFPCLAVVLLLIGWALRGRWDAHWTLALWLGGAGAGTGAVLYALPQIARPFYLFWMGLACCMGIVISNLMLAGFYYLAMTPFGVTRRLVRSRFRKTFDRQRATYWKDAGPPAPPARYYKQF